MDIDLIFKIAAIGIIVAVLNLLLKRAERDEQAMMTTLAGLIVVLLMIVRQIGNLFETIKEVIVLMKIFTIACFCIFSTIMCKAIEKDSREIKYAAVLAAAALVLFHSVAFVKDLISVFEDLFTLSGIDNMYLAILFKSLGICYIVQLASDYCKDCGENALASQVTLAGKLAMLSVSLPLFKAFVEIVKALLI